VIVASGTLHVERDLSSGVLTQPYTSAEENNHS
jgi:hypothetical protein